MTKKLKTVQGGVLAPQGFLGSGVFCDIKRLGTGKGSQKGKKRDLALIVSEIPGTVAGLFTTNQICAAPVKVCLEHLKGGIGQAIVVNSGNANACTGRQGLRDARLMTELTSRALHMPAGHVFVGSTGRIGVQLPMANVKSGLAEAVALLGNELTHGAEVAEAIMTSDTKPKEIAVEIRLSGKPVRIGGVCKGAGMIQPGMSPTGKRPATRPKGLHATMLCFITTDALIERKALQSLLEQAVALSFNRITIDGDMSTNDTVLVLANGLAENPGIRTAAVAQALGSQPKSRVEPARSKDVQLFQSALEHVCLELAKMIVRDGEGVSRFVTVRVQGARSMSEADAAARAVANSALVKTSWHGGDPNWGRIIDALGYSQATVIEDKVDIGYSAPGSKRILWSLRRGQPTGVSFRQLCAAVAQPEFDLHIALNLGEGRSLIYAADLTEEYVDFNKGDVSDPKSLGG